MPASPERVWRAIQEVRAVIPATFDYEVAGSVDEAIALLGQGEDAKLLAGGHSLLPLMKLRFARPALLVDIGRLADLVLRARRRRHGRDRRAHAPPRRRHERAARASDVRDRRRHGGADRRPAGAPPRHDRRLGRPRRPRLRPPDGRCSRSTPSSSSRGPGGERTIAAGGLLHRLPRDGARAAGRADRDPRAEARGSGGTAT